MLKLSINPDRSGRKYLIVSLLVIGFLCITTLSAQEDLYPPTDLTASDNQIGVINLNWVAPTDSSAMELFYDDGIPENYYVVDDPPLSTHHMAVGFTFSEDCWVNVGRFLMAYDAGATSFDYHLFGGTSAGPDASNVLATGTCTLDGDPNGDWYDVDLGGIAITAGDWFYLDVQYRDGMVVNTDCYYAGGDESNPDPYSWYTLDGTSWTNLGTMVDVMLRTVISTSSGKSIVLNPMSVNSNSSASVKQLADLPKIDDELLTKFTSRPYARPKTRVVRDTFEHYNIYREGALIDTSATEFYADSDINPETYYDYYVTAQYAEGESDSTNHATGYALSVPEIIEIGQADGSWYKSPMNIFFQNSISEVVYQQEWINIPCFINSIAYHANIVTDNINPFGLKVFMGELPNADLSAGWITADQLTLVYDGTIAPTVGDYWLQINLDTQFTYLNTGNLVIMVVKDDDEYYSSSNVFYYTESGIPAIGRHYYSDTIEPDPYTISDNSSDSPTPRYPDIQIFWSAIGYGNVDGTVTDATTSLPIEGAFVNIYDEQAETGPDGTYLIENIPISTYDITCTADGYYPAADVVEILANQTVTVDFALESLVYGILDGTVIDDSTGLPIPGAGIEVVGDYEYNTTTNDAGYYIIEDIIAGTYDVTCSADLYEPQTVEDIEITAGETITLDFALTLYTVPTSYWSDFEANDGGLTSNDPTGWQWGSPTAGPPSAYSGVNVWGTNLSGDYASDADYRLETPELAIASSGYMLEFWQWYDIEGPYTAWDGGNVKISTDGGTTWQVIEPIGGYPDVADDANAAIPNEPCFSDESGGWVKAEFDLSGYVGEIVHFRWHFGSDGSVTYPGWYIDNVRMYKQEFGSLEGYVTELDGGAPIDSAEVTIGGQYTGYSDDTGHYLIENVVTFTYDVTCEAEGYNDAFAEDVEIITDQTTTLNFTMTAPTMDVYPTSIDTTIAPDDSLTTYVTISNNGNGPLDWSGSIVESGALKINFPPGSNSFPRIKTSPSLGRAPLGKDRIEYSEPKIDILRGSTAWANDVITDVLVTFDTDVPGTMLSSISVPWSSFAGDFGADDETTMYIIDSGDGYLKAVDITTGVATNIGVPSSSGLSWTGLACDKSTGVMYASATNVSVSNLYTIDLTTGDATLIGDTGIAGLIDIAIDGNGVMYGYCIVSDASYTIDKTTGVGTELGPIGFDANYAQGMSWDPAGDVVYLSAYNNTSGQGELRILDRATGNTTLVGAFSDGDEVCALGFPGGGVNWIKIVPTSGTIETGGSFDVAVIFNSTDIEPGTTKTADINFTSTPDVGIETVDVTLTVGENEFGSISGIVTLEDTPYSSGNVQDVVITAGSYSTSPDEFGNYTLSVYPNIYSVTASLDNYEDSTIVDVEVEEATNTPNIDFELNCLLGALAGDVTDFDTGLPIVGATVTVLGDKLTRDISDTTDVNGHYEITDIKEGIYDIEAAHEDYVPVIVEDVEILQDVESTQNFVLQEVGLAPPRNLVASEDNPDGILVTWLPPSGGTGDEFTEGFESGDIPEGWLAIDNDGDSYNWGVWDAFVHTGTYSACSFSYINYVGAVTPDNYLITPQVELGSSSVLTFWVGASDAAWYWEHFKVMLSTTGSNPADFTEELLDYTLTTDTWTELTIDLSSYSGQSVYLAWEHCEVTDVFNLSLDDIALTNAKQVLFSADFESPSDIKKFKTVSAYQPEVDPSDNNMPFRVENSMSEDEVNNKLAEYKKSHPKVVTRSNSRDFLDKYNLYRGETSGGPYTLVDTCITETEYLDTDVALGEVWYYVATALYDTEVPYEESPYSNEDSGQLFDAVPPPPDSVWVSGVDDEVTISWFEVIVTEDDIDYYNIYKKYMDGDYEVIGNTSEITYDYTLVDGEGVYKFYVTAVDLSGQESEPSESYEYIYGVLPPLIDAESGYDEQVPIHVAPWSSGTEVEYDLIYDDGVPENATAWYNAGNMNAVRFTPVSYPCEIKTAYINVYDGTWPSGANLQPFEIAIFDDDGTGGFPGTELGRLDVTPTNYNFVEVDLSALEISIDDGDFYIAHIQGGDHPNCLPIAIDETTPTVNRSYSRYITGGEDWELSGYQDFMIRATVTGPEGPALLTEDGSVVTFTSEEITKEMVKEGYTPPRVLAHYVNPKTGTELIGNGTVIKRFIDSITGRDITGYKIYRSLDSLSFDMAYEIEGGGPQDWIDYDVINDTTYWYYATAIYDLVNESDPSEIVDATPYDQVAPGPVTDLEYTVDVAALTVEFTWSDPTDADLAGIEIYRDEVLIVTVEPGVQTYTDVVPETGYYIYSFYAVDEVPNPSEPVERVVWIDYILWAEDFSAGIMPPTGCSIVGDFPNNWKINDGSQAGGEAPEAKFDWLPDSGYEGTARLVSPVLNTTGMELTFEFKHFGDAFSMAASPSTIGVATTSDSGATWNEAWSTILNTEDIPAETVTFDIDTPDVGSSTFQLCFFYVGDPYEIMGWHIDDILLSYGYVSVGDEFKPSVTALRCNYPNPFNNSTTFSFSLKEKSPVKLSVYNIKGQLVTTLVDNEMNPGNDYKIVWDGKNGNTKLANGIYFYKLETKNKTFIKKMILLH